jgi:hypothetical protein
MARYECEFEAEVLAAAIQSRWPNRVDPALREHASRCQVCSDVAVVAAAIDTAREETRELPALPDAGRVWWIAQMRARREAAVAAARPITATQLIAGACAVGLLGACFGATSAWFQESLHRLATIDAPGLLAQHGALAAGIGAVLILVPAAAWLALRKD